MAFSANQKAAESSSANQKFFQNMTKAQKQLQDDRQDERRKHWSRLCWGNFGQLERKNFRKIQKSDNYRLECRTVHIRGPKGL